LTTTPPDFASLSKYLPPHGLQHVEILWSQDVFPRFVNPAPHLCEQPPTLTEPLEDAQLLGNTPRRLPTTRKPPQRRVSLQVDTDESFRLEKKKKHKKKRRQSKHEKKTRERRVTRRLSKQMVDDAAEEEESPTTTTKPQEPEEKSPERK